MGQALQRLQIKRSHERKFVELQSSSRDSTAAGAPGFAGLQHRHCKAGARTGTGKPGPGLARGSTSAVLARGYRPRASGEPKARPLTEGGIITGFTSRGD